MVGCKERSGTSSVSLRIPARIPTVEPQAGPLTKFTLLLRDKHFDNSFPTFQGVLFYLTVSQDVEHRVEVYC